ncbi:MAG: Uma2 family endonuclease [Labilithrix sp.]|nr:Uma2 family endonuclease [Labilithrix sp.]MCW5812245.1 Uma2 family endonuclease [Labilithrix sp.]
MSMSMSQPPFPRPDVSHLITEDGAPVDSFFAEKEMRLLTQPLAAWRHPEGRRLIAAANVGVFAVMKNPALVPDVFVSFDVDPPPLSGPERLNSYFIWEFGKPPDIVIEIVSDKEGGELSDKLRAYERMRVTHYVVFDPLNRISEEELLAFSLHDGVYVRRDDLRFAAEGLALTFWTGEFESARERWLRWTDLDGKLIPTLEEHAKRAERAAEQVEALRAQLRALGIEPEG